MAQELNSTVTNLIQNLASSDDLTRMKARKTLVEIGSPTVPGLIESLSNPHPLVRWEIVKALAEIRDPKTAPVLVNCLEDDEFDVRWVAAEALIGLNVKGLKPLLEALIRHSDSVAMREGGHHVLHDLAQGELRKYLAPVLIALEGVESSIETPIAAARALHGLEEFLGHQSDDPFLRSFTTEQRARTLTSRLRARSYTRSLRKL